MNKKIIQVSVALLMVFSVSASTFQSYVADSNIIDGGSRTYCEAYAALPFKNGSTVYGLGYVACTTSVSRITVDVQVRDRGSSCGDVERETNPAATNTCYNTDYCSVYASLSYVSGHYYDTVTSGYWPGDNDFYASNCVYIP